MRTRLAALATALLIALAACGGGGDGDDPANSGSDLDGGISGFPGMVDRANDIGDASNQRLTDIQNQLQP